MLGMTVRLATRREAEIVPLHGEAVRAAAPGQAGRAATRDVYVAARETPEVSDKKDVAAAILSVHDADTVVKQAAPRLVDRAKPGTVTAVVVAVGEVRIAVAAPVKGRGRRAAAVMGGSGGSCGREKRRKSEAEQSKMFLAEHRRMFLWVFFEQKDFYQYTRKPNIQSYQAIKQMS